MTTRERKEARAERFRGWAEKRQAQAAAVFKAHEQYRGDTAFNTQPGHIPERARVIAREDRAYRSIEKAQGMASRAAGIEDQLDRSIYSDDEDAVERLRERIAGLEAERDRIKAYNASCRKGGPDPAILDEAQRADLVRCLRYQAYACKGGAFPAYALTNLSGNIKRNRDRLTEIERQTQQRGRAVDSGGVTVTASGGYAAITFAEYPGRPMVTALKAAGWHYSGGSWHGSLVQLPTDCPAGVDPVVWHQLFQ